MDAPKKEQPEVPAVWPPTMAVCVGTVVLKEDTALLIRQAKGHALAGQWSIPWGLVDTGETPEQAALRETREESGVTAAVDGLLGIQNLRTPGWLAVIFLCHHVEGEPAADGVETDRAAYLSLEDLDALADPVEVWCEWLVRRVLAGEHTIVPCEPASPYHPRLAFL
ncbi:MAG: NUDIX domain-containing protein [Anaerolineae bacterium]|nr:NUDIX domain-containing protein [Anaerolineae bacterium]